MLYAIKGIQKVDYKNKEGKQVTGLNLHCTYSARSVDGDAVEKIYVSDRMKDVPMFKVGDTVDVMYNKYGSVECISLA